MGGPTTIFDDFLPWNGASTACTGNRTVYPGNNYSLTLKSVAEVNGNTIQIHEDADATIDPYYHVVLFWSPTANGTKNIITSENVWWNMAAAAGHAMYRRNGGVTGETFTLFTQNPGGNPLNVNKSLTVGTLMQIGENHRDNRYVIVHELGHALLFAAAGEAPASSEGADVDGCYTNNFGHEFNSKEYNGIAASEGFAHYYAAVAFNSTAQTDCMYYGFYRVDWDLDIPRDVTDETFEFSCEGHPVTAVSDGDYLGQNCLGPGTVEINRGNEYDWLRFLWDLDSNTDMDFNDLVDIWAMSNPASWVIGDTVYPYNPSYMIFLAFDPTWRSEWDLLATYHGVDR